MLDAATRLIPFISHNDCVRCQMAATQTKQAIPLINAEVPFIRTGFEESYLDYTSYLYIAKDDGIVTYKDDILMICKYDNMTHGELIKLGGAYANKEGFHKQLFTTYNQGDRFNKNDILARHSSINENGFLTLGMNLKTTYISCPYNYKDAIVISESCAKKMTTTYIHEEVLNCTDTIPILWHNGNISYDQGTYVTKAQTIFVVKERHPINPMHVISKGEEILAPASGKLYYKIIVDEVVRTRDEEDYYSSLYKEEITKEDLIASKIKELYDKDNPADMLECNAYISYYCPQLNKQRSGKSIVLCYWIVEECPLIIGCKLSNRHGNKGVISKIFEDKDMPRTLNGEIADIIINPLTITSRMNVGQLFELHLTRSNHIYTSKVMADNDLSMDEKIDKLGKMLSCVQPNYINKVFDDFKKNAPQSEKEKFLEDVAKHNIVEMVQPGFTQFTYEDALRFCKTYGGLPDSLKEPVIFNNEQTEASIGYGYWYRLEHEPNKKYFARSVGLYGKIGQPGRNSGGNRGAHRVGELETWALLAHQAYENLLEFFVTKSDSISEAARMLKYIYDGCPHRYTPFIQTPGILKVFKTFVNAAGYEMVDIDTNEAIDPYTTGSNDQPDDNVLDCSDELKIITDTMIQMIEDKVQEQASVDDEDDHIEEEDYDG